jgi:hypothetical protein
VYQNFKNIVSTSLQLEIENVVYFITLIFKYQESKNFKKNILKTAVEYIYKLHNTYLNLIYFFTLWEVRAFF